MSGTNSIGMIVIGILGFVAIIITGKWLLDKKDHHHPQTQPLPAVAQKEQPPATPAAPQVCQPYPHTYPHYHTRNDFWQGYADGWNGQFTRQSSPEYIQGYQIGTHDRKCGKHDYYEKNCPPGFSLKVPGFKLDVR